jgi:hypothetical protein
MRRRRPALKHGNRSYWLATLRPLLPLVAGASLFGACRESHSLTGVEIRSGPRLWTKSTDHETASMSAPGGLCQFVAGSWRKLTGCLVPLADMVEIDCLSAVRQTLGSHADPYAGCTLSSKDPCSPLDCLLSTAAAPWSLRLRKVTRIRLRDPVRGPRTAAIECVCSIKWLWSSALAGCGECPSRLLDLAR